MVTDRRTVPYPDYAASEAEVARLTALLKESDDERVALKEHYPRLRADLAAARAERDGLATALRRVVDADPSAASQEAARREARAALAALPTAPKEEDHAR